MPPSLIDPALAESSAVTPCSSWYVSQRPVDENRRFKDLRSVQWRINLGILPSSSSIDDIRRVTADSRRRYAGLRRRLLVDPHIPKDGTTTDLGMDNPLSLNPDSTWSQFFRNAELEKMVELDLTRLYPEHGNYFQTPGCQGMLRRILLLWCLRHPECGYRQGMHELLAPLLYVLHVDVEHLSQVQELYEDLFTDKFDGLSLHNNDLTYNFDLTKSPDSIKDEIDSEDKLTKVKSFDELDPVTQTIVLLSDAYGAEGELGIVLSEKFMEHDAYCMFDALMSGSHGSVVMAELFSPILSSRSRASLPPVIEASDALYSLLSLVDSSLHSHLVGIGVEPQFFALRWLLVLFGREFTLRDLLIIWDEIFASDNSKIDKGCEDDGFGVLNSARGAFISSLAVSMLLYLRSSLLATEDATSCLQRLQSFPENVDLKKLLEKANSLRTLVLITNASISCPSFGGPYDFNKSMAMRGHSPSLDSVSPNSLLNVVPGSYWEEKWRVLHREEELRQDYLKKQQPTPKKGWTENVRLSLSRSESAPRPTKHENGESKYKTSVRRRLLEDLSWELGFDEDPDKLECCKDLGHINKVPVEESNEDDHDKKYINFTAEGKCLNANAGNEENSSVYSDARCLLGGTNDNENESGKSSFASNSFAEENNDNHSRTTLEDSPLPISDPPDDLSQKAESNNDDSTGNSVAEIKERRIPSGKFQWLWKFNRNAAGAGGTSEKGGNDMEATKPVNNESDQPKATSSGDDGPRNSTVSCKGNAVDQNMMGTLKNLGHSMLEHILVIESTLQQDRGLVGKGQVTAMSALKELRKISNLLSEM